MSRKDYIAIAKILRAQWETANMHDTSKGVIWTTTLSVADVFAQDNVRFDRAKFYEYVFGTSDHFAARREVKTW